ncbi:hypothetical protein Syun_013131 [Stephania yunnanensis]|uniref:Uncharacterized protein n=1 Tax=Stephania yunnanensis TaxID=152371 RepID=A0AAP0K0T5_9MAGN
MEVAQNAMGEIPRETKKRKLESVDHGCFEICNLIKDFRPHFIEVLRAPDFRNSKAAHEIRQPELWGYKGVIPSFLSEKRRHSQLKSELNNLTHPFVSQFALCVLSCWYLAALKKEKDAE